MKNSLIIGDGIIGMLSAISLSNIYENVYLVRNSKKKYRESKINRHFSINLLSKYFFMKMGIWDDIMISTSRPYNKIITWSDNMGEEVKFESSSISYDSLGYIIKEDLIINSLTAKLSAINNIEIIDDSDINSISYNDNCHKVTLSDDKTINLNLIIKSDNSIDFLLNSLELNKKSIEYNQHALVIDLHLEGNTVSNIAYQKFLDGQILGLLPITQNKYNLIWSVNNDILDDLKNQDDKNIISVLNSHLSEKVGSIKSISDRVIFPLSGFHVESYVTNNILVIGGAAHSVHPMAGLGLNMGIQDIYLLENSFLKMSSDNHNLNQVLENFNSSCILENSKTYNAINFLKKFYSDNLIPNYLKTQSLRIFNKSKYLKIKAIESATGIDVLKRTSVDKYCYPN